MTALEIRYRRLLRVYPAGHRDAYEEEMIGVLMADAEPGRRFPAPADALDLLRAGLAARLGRLWQAQRRTGWRDAAAVTGLLVALTMAGIATGRLAAGFRMFAIHDDPMRAYGVDGALLLDPAVRALAWVLVSAAALAGLRRSAVGLAAFGVLAEAGAVFWWAGIAPWQSLRLAWAPALAMLVLAVLALAVRARRVPAIIGPRGARRVAVAVGAVVVFWALLGTGAVRLSFPMSADLLKLLAPVVLLAAAVRGVRPAIGRRVAALTVALLAVPFVFLRSWGWMGLAAAVDMSPGIVTQRVVVLLLTPVVIFAIGLVVLEAGERFAVRGRGQVRAHE